MEKDDSLSFCPYCGRKFEADDDGFCPECGKMIVRGPFERVKEAVQQRKSMVRLNWTIVFLGVFSVFSIFGAIVAFISIGMSNDMMEAAISTHFSNDITNLGLSVEQYVEALKVDGAISIVVGIFAIISLYCCLKRIHFNIALGACIATSLGLIVEFLFMSRQMIIASLLGTFIQVAIGFIIARMIYLSRDQFIDQKATEA